MLKEYFSAKLLFHKFCQQTSYFCIGIFSQFIACKRLQGDRKFRHLKVEECGWCEEGDKESLSDFVYYTW